MISAGWKWIERGTDLLWPASLEILFAATLLLVIAVAMHFALGRAAASLRHRVWALTMGALLLVPLLCPILPKLPLPLSIPLAENRPVASRPVVSTPERSSESAIALPPREGTATDIVAFRSAKEANDPALHFRGAKGDYQPISRTSVAVAPHEQKRRSRKRPFPARQKPLCVRSRLGAWHRALSAGDGSMAMAGAGHGEERPPA